MQSVESNPKKKPRVPKYLNEEDIAKLPDVKKFTPSAPTTLDALTFEFVISNPPSETSTSVQATQPYTQSLSNTTQAHVLPPYIINPYQPHNTTSTDMPINPYVTQTTFIAPVPVDMESFSSEVLTSPAQCTEEEACTAPQAAEGLQLQTSAKNWCTFPDADLAVAKQLILSKNLKGFEHDLAVMIETGFHHHYFLESLAEMNIRRPERHEIMAEASKVSTVCSVLGTPFYVQIGPRIVAANPAMCSLLGVPESHITQLMGLELLHPDDLVAFFKKTLMAYLTNKQPEPCTVRLRKELPPPLITPYAESLIAQNNPQDLMAPVAHLVDVLHRCMHTPCNNYITCVLSPTYYRHMGHIPTFTVTNCVRIDNVPNVRV